MLERDHTSDGGESSHNSEGSREVPPPSDTPPEGPNLKSLFRGLTWIGAGSTLIGISKAVGDESLYPVGLTIMSLGVYETTYRLLYRKK